MMDEILEKLEILVAATAGIVIGLVTLFTEPVTIHEMVSRFIVVVSLSYLLARGFKLYLFTLIIRREEETPIGVIEAELETIGLNDDMGFGTTGIDDDFADFDDKEYEFKYYSDSEEKKEEPVVAQPASINTEDVAEDINSWQDNFEADMSMVFESDVFEDNDSVEDDIKDDDFGDMTFEDSFEDFEMNFEDDFFGEEARQ